MATTSSSRPPSLEGFAEDRMDLNATLSWKTPSSTRALSRSLAEQITTKITRRRRETVHLKTPDFAARVYFLVICSALLRIRQFGQRSDAGASTQSSHSQRSTQMMWGVRGLYTHCHRTTLWESRSVPFRKSASRFREWYRCAHSSPNESRSM